MSDGVTKSDRVDAAVRILRSELRQEILESLTVDPEQFGPRIFGLTIPQVRKLRAFYVEHTGKRPEDL